MMSTSMPAPSRAAAAISRADWIIARQRLVGISGAQRVELDRRESLLERLAGALEDLLRAVALERKQQVEADLVPELAAEEVPDRRAVVLALDVPQGDVDRRKGARQDVAAERPHPVERLLDVVDPEGVLADEVLAELVHDRLGRIGKPHAPD